MADLATHVATIPMWAGMTMSVDRLDMAEAGERPKPASSRAELLDRFDANVRAGRDAIAGAEDERMLGSWTLLNGGNTILSMPRTAVLRTFVMNHMIHHRGQLGVYLRLNDVPVPAIYGPSADEGGM
jgi:uncharacterized damage-inducible protein DinB